MKIVTQDIPYLLFYPITKSYVKEEISFFDIETTGFSVDMSYVYLISCGYYDGDSWKLIQWFSEGIEEEEQLLRYFFEFISPYKLLVHYNGTTFDMPYLLNKSTQYGLSYNFDHITSLDIYKQIIPYKKKLPLENLKLKTVERFLGIHRKDPFHGGELIKVYTDFVGRNAYEKLHKDNPNTYFVSKESGLPTVCKTPASQMLDALLLHNAEDVMGLLKIMDVLSYVDLFHGRFVHSKAILQDNFITFTLTLEHELITPLQFTQTLGDFEFLVMANGVSVTLSLPISHLTLKYYFENYKDYYYLPVEDTAIHKTIGEYVDKEFRVNAKPSTCYTKKEGDYLPQPYKLYTPAFQQEYKSKLYWFEVNEAFYKDEQKQMDYIRALLE